MVGIVNTSTFKIAAREILKNHGTTENKVFKRRWMSAFGTTPENCCIIWNMIDPPVNMANGVEHCHLLWCLYFMKNYNTESINAANVGGVDEKMFRKWTWLFVDEISFLEYPLVRSVCFVLPKNG